MTGTQAVAKPAPGHVVSNAPAGTAVHGRRVLAGIVAVVLAGCAPVTNLTYRFTSAARLAGTVTITRDSWGVPHIAAPTDAGVAFGVGYAQAEDELAQIEQDYLFALGRAASVYGATALNNDLVRAAFEVERLAREEYEREPPERRAVWDGYAAGLNHYVRTHRHVRLRALRRFEPWYPFTLQRAAGADMEIDGARLRDVLAVPVGGLAVTRAVLPADTDGGTVASGPVHRDPAPADHGRVGVQTAWAVAPSRTRDGAAFLLLNPGGDYFGSGRLWEVHVTSDEGWDVWGFATLGTPVPRSGHNGTLGWTHTATTADIADAYLEDFDHEADPLAYRFGDGWRNAVQFEAELAVATQAGMERRRYRFLRTHRGPVIAMPDGRRATVRIARFVEGGALQQWYAMGRARSLDEFRAALAAAAIPDVNTLYADRAGNIYYVHGNAVPRRDPRRDWSRPVDGADTVFEWQGYHQPGELPHLLNPASGWIQDASSSPFHVTESGANPDSTRFPSYMASRLDGARAAAARSILSAAGPWTLDAWESAVFDLRVTDADRSLRRIITEWERLGARDPGRAARIDHSIETLRAWNRTSGIGSAAMTLFVLWSERITEIDTDPGEFPAVRALELVIDELHRNWGTSTVAWGAVNRLRRTTRDSDGLPAADSDGLPAAAAPGSLGIVFDSEASPDADRRRRYGRRGHGWVAVVEFGATIRTRSVVAFGQSADPLSPHWFDQAPLWTSGRFKTVWFDTDDVAANSSIRYTPGKRPGGDPDRS